MAFCPFVSLQCLAGCAMTPSSKFDGCAMLYCIDSDSCGPRSVARCIDVPRDQDTRRIRVCLTKAQPLLHDLRQAVSYYDSCGKLPNPAIQCTQRLIVNAPKRFTPVAEWVLEKLGTLPRSFEGQVAETVCAALAPRWTSCVKRAQQSGAQPSPELFSTPCRYATWLRGSKPDKSTFPAGKAYQNEDISRTISRCREHATRLCCFDRRAPKQSGPCRGKRGISPQMFHIAELYQTHVVGRKIADRHTETRGLAGGTGMRMPR